MYFVALVTSLLCKRSYHIHEVLVILVRINKPEGVSVPMQYTVDKAVLVALLIICIK